MTDDGLTSRERRWLVRRWHHAQREWTPCYDLYGGLCMRCWWRERTGRNARDKAAFIAQVRQRTRDACPLVVRKGADGKWRPAKDARPD